MRTALVRRTHTVSCRRKERSRLSGNAVSREPKIPRELGMTHCAHGALPHESGEQIVQRGGWITRESGVHGPGCTAVLAGAVEPAEPLGLRPSRHGAASGVASGHGLQDRELPRHRLQVELRPERA